MNIFNKLLKPFIKQTETTGDQIIDSPKPEYKNPFSFTPLDIIYLGFTDGKVTFKNIDVHLTMNERSIAFYINDEIVLINNQEQLWRNVWYKEWANIDIYPELITFMNGLYEHLKDKKLAIENDKAKRKLEVKNKIIEAEKHNEK